MSAVIPTATATAVKAARRSATRGSTTISTDHDPMRIAIAGKGGTGKTTIAGTLARALARTGREVLAIDADTNPNLASVLGIPPASAEAIVSLPRNLMKKETLADGTTRTVFSADPEELIGEFAIRGPDGVQLMVMGRVGHGGAG